MPWKKVIDYSFGFNQTDQQFWIYYTLEDVNITTQILLTPDQCTALATMFNAAAEIHFETDGKYFQTQPRNL